MGNDESVERLRVIAEDGEVVVVVVVVLLLLLVVLVVLVVVVVAVVVVVVLVVVHVRVVVLSWCCLRCSLTTAPPQPLPSLTPPS